MYYFDNLKPLVLLVFRLRSLPPARARELPHYLKVKLLRTFGNCVDKVLLDNFAHSSCNKDKTKS